MQVTRPASRLLKFRTLDLQIVAFGSPFVEGDSIGLFFKMR